MLESDPPAAAGDTDACGAGGSPGAPARSVAPPPVRGVEGAPSGVPLEVLEALDEAQDVQAELDGRGLLVSFDRQAGGAVLVSLLDGSGAVVCELSPSEALEALSDEQSIKRLAE